MSYLTDAASVIQTFETEFSALFPTVPIEHENTKPVDTSTATEWVRFVMQEGDNTQKTLGRVGERSYEQLGIIQVQIFIRTGTGAGRSRVLAQAIKTILQGKTFGDVKTRAVRMAHQGVSGVWHQRNVIVPYTSRELG